MTRGLWPDLGRRVCHGRDIECRTGRGTGDAETAHQQRHSSWDDQPDPRDQCPSVRFGDGWDGAGGDRSQDGCSVTCQGEELDWPSGATGTGTDAVVVVSGKGPPHAV